MRKGGGFVFTEDELIDLMSRIRGKEYPKYPRWLHGIGQFSNLCDKRGMGIVKFISLFKGMDERTMEGYVRSYMLVTRVKELDEDETAKDFRDIPFEPEHAGVKYVISCMKEYGYTDDDLEKRWSTLSEWYFMEH